MTPLVSLFGGLFEHDAREDLFQVPGAESVSPPALLPYGLKDPLLDKVGERFGQGDFAESLVRWAGRCV